MSLPHIHCKKVFIYRKKRLSQKIEEGYRMLISIVVVFGLGLSFTYISFQTHNAALGYELTQIKNQYEELDSKNFFLTQKVLQAQSMHVLEGDTYTQKMFVVKQDNMAYAPITDIAVLPFRVEENKTY
jgi:hypothetical protein